MINSDSIPPSSTILHAIRWATARFESCPFDSPRLNAELLLGHILKLGRLDLYLKFDRPLSGDESHRYIDLVTRRMQGTPVQYIIGTVEFYDLTFNVTPAVLIPRPETEILVDEALAFIQQLELTGDRAPASQQLDLFSQNQAVQGGTVLDIGTGSGAIALTLAHHHGALTVYATDISSEAIAVARQNADQLGADVTFFEGRYCEPLNGRGMERTFDLIVSNPPYIPRKAIESLPEEIRVYEPIQALDGGDDGLECLRAVITQAPQYLRPGGRLIMEIGEGQATGVLQEFERHPVFDTVKIIQDYNRLDRVVSALRVDQTPT